MIHTLIHKSKIHWLAIVIATAIGILTISPHLMMFTVISPDEFNGVYPLYSDDAEAYQARIKEVMEGNFGIGNTSIAEHKNDIFIQPPLSEWIIASLVFITGQSVPFITMASDFIFPFICFILLYILLNKITKRKDISLFYTTTFFILWLQTFGRPISPQLNMVPVFIGLILIYTLYNKTNLQINTQRKLAISIGFITGLLLFISPYYWTTLLLLYFLLLGSTFIRNKDVQKLKHNTLWFLSTFAPLLSIYAFFHQRAASLPFYLETTERFGLMNTHYPGSHTNVALGFITGSIILVSYKLFSKKQFLFLLSLAVSIVILNWQNIITGQSIQFASHYRLISILYIIITLAFINVCLIKSYTPAVYRYTKALALLGMIGMFSILIYMQKSEVIRIWSYDHDRETFLALQEKADTFKWLNENTPKNSTVYTLGGNYDSMLPIYTENSVYLSFHANLYTMSNEETESRWLRQHIFTPELSSEYITANQRHFWGNRFLDSYNSKENRKKIIAKLTGQPYIPAVQFDPVLIEQLVDRGEALKNQDLYSVLKTYQIDYILISKDYEYNNIATLAIENLKEVVLVARINNDYIYNID